eukprot:167810_1
MISLSVLYDHHMNHSIASWVTPSDTVCLWIRIPSGFSVLQSSFIIGTCIAFQDQTTVLASCDPVATVNMHDSNRRGHLGDVVLLHVIGLTYNTPITRRE